MIEFQHYKGVGTLGGLLWFQAKDIFSAIAGETIYDEGRFDAMMNLFHMTALPIVEKNKDFPEDWAMALQLQPEEGEYYEVFMRRQLYYKYKAIIKALVAEGVWNQKDHETASADSL